MTQAQRKRYVGRRFQGAPEATGRANVMKPDHPALTEARTIYPKTVRVPGPGDNILKSGKNNPKIGDRVTAGRWAGMPIYYLTLEERATCPSSCVLWAGCYGNGMHRAHRWDLRTRDSRSQLMHELEGLNDSFPRGFVVRLHILGDFFSVDYVGLWANALFLFERLHIWGYTARDHQLRDQIGQAIQDRIVIPFPGRVSMRISRARPVDHMNEALTVGAGETLPPASFLCPAEDDPEVACGNCCACWESRRNVVFRLHGGK